MLATVLVVPGGVWKTAEIFPLLCPTSSPKLGPSNEIEVMVLVSKYSM